MKRIIIFCFCILICSFLFFSSSSYADVVRDKSYRLTSFNGFDNDLNPYLSSFDLPEDQRVCFLFNQEGSSSGGHFYGTYTLYTSYNGSVSYRRYVNGQTLTGNFSSSLIQISMYILTPSGSTAPWGNNRLTVSTDSGSICPIFTDFDDVVSYIVDGSVPEVPYNEDIKLDNFYCWDYALNDASSPDYVVPEYTTGYKAIWSDPRINTVRVRIDSTSRTEDFLSQSSPFVGYFRANNYANLNGDVINIIATPYTSDGTYGQSMYCSFTYDGNNPLTNIFRKLFKNEHYNNTIEIPYNGNDVTYDVDGVATNTTYVVHYDPTYNRFYDSRVYEINYSPVIIYPSETSNIEITETQNYITNNYITNNYNNFYNNLDLDFDFNFNDVSTGDIQQMYDDTTGMISLIGNLFGLIGTLFATCFPFLMFDIPGWLLFFGGLFLVAAGIGLFIKIVSFFRG